MYCCQESNVYIKNIHDEVDDDALRARFAEFGNITSVKVMRDDKGISRGFGFVCYSTPEEAKSAVNSMRGNPMFFLDPNGKSILNCFNKKPVTCLL
jgi:polyadenylate-binding protein